QRGEQCELLGDDGIRQCDQRVGNVAEVTDVPGGPVVGGLRGDFHDVLVAEGSAQFVGDVLVVAPGVGIGGDEHEAERSLLQYRLRPVPEAERGIPVADDLACCEFQQLECCLTSQPG